MIANIVNTGNDKYASSDINDIFVSACENGDYLIVAHILKLSKDFNVEVTNTLGKSALVLAIEHEHFEVVLLLLDKLDNQKLREALLLAIYLGHTNIAFLIFKHPKYNRLNEKKFVDEDQDSFWQIPSSNDAQFSPDITPLILASQYKRTEIVQLLLINGERITKPHIFNCKCNECSNKFKFDSLRHAQSRLNAYRALSSESYLSLASLDPLQAAFELAYEIKILAQKEKYFKKEYLQLAQNLSQYTVKLLNNVRGRDELEILLNKTGKDNEEKYIRLARINLALRYQEKPFVAHPNCQQKLQEIWYKGVRNVANMNQLYLIFNILIFIIVLPFTCLICLVRPNSKVGKLMQQPYIKFLAHTSTYIVFIGMIVTSSLQFASDQRNRERFSNVYKKYAGLFYNYSINTDLEYRFPCQDFYMRLQSPNNLDYAITIWVIGYIWYEGKKIYGNGLRQYLYFWSNIISLTNCVLYLCSYGLKYYTNISVLILRKEISQDSFWNQIEGLRYNDTEKLRKFYEIFYWLNDDRFYWTSMDPINLAEGLFAIANMLTFLRICFLLPAYEALGPLQIILGKMISDVVKFLSIFVIIFVAFLFGVNNLYWYYQAAVRDEVEIVKHSTPNSAQPKAEEFFGSLGNTLKSLYFALFGIGRGDDTDLAPNYNNLFTSDFGIFLHGSFHISFILLLINMLIAMMTKSYERIRENSDIEWKFARSKLYMEYIKEGQVLPVPFNILPSLENIKNIFVTCLELFIKCKSNKTEKQNTPNNTIPMREAKNQNQLANETHKSKDESDSPKPSRKLSIGGSEITYTKVIQRIIKRFLLRNIKDSDEQKEGHLNEIKNELKMARFEITDAMKSAQQNALKTFKNLHSNVSVITEEVVKNTSNTELNFKYQRLKKDEVIFDQIN